MAGVLREVVAADVHDVEEMARFESRVDMSFVWPVPAWNCRGLVACV